MKKNFTLFLSFIALIFITFSSSCDKIENPLKPVFGDLDTSLYPGPGIYEFPEFDEEYPSQVENILVEDYTGHRCGNCPDAAIVAHDLKEANPGRVFVASIHAAPGDGFQYVSVEGDSEYPKYSHEFRTVEGDAYVADIDGFFGNPMGMVNRMYDEDFNTNWKTKSVWAAAVQEIITENEPLKMNLQVKTKFYTETRGLFVHVKSETYQDIDASYSLVVMLLQDNYKDWQKDYNLPPDIQDIEFYHHKDVFLRTINGSYGSQLFAEVSSQGEVFENHFSIEVDESIELEGSGPNETSGLSVVAYIMDNSNYEIIQVVEQHVVINY